ncbi:MAG TPA: hypothetical protein VHK24_11625 [Steroidobacter sp.]|jgi:hypothetical protein|nr:hypothetical protein [Steroidobacter sp.]
MHMLLRRMQTLLSSLYDAPVEQDIQNFLFCDRRGLQAVVGEEVGCISDEQVLMMQDEESVCVGVFIDQPVLDRLAARDPLRALTDDNLPDYCTALEGVSHFHYLTWSLAHSRRVSLLELELQAEVDKYACALALLLQQRGGCFPTALHARLFDAVRFLPQSDAAVRRRYEEANRHAARYCRALDEKYLKGRRSRPEAWIAELRRFFRCGHQEKIRQLAV